MKRLELINALNKANTCTDENPIAPALSYVNFTSKEVKSFNGIQAFSMPFETEFPFIVQGKFLEDFLKLVTSDEVEVILHKNILKVRSGKMEISLDTLDAEDFLYAQNNPTTEDEHVLTPNFFVGLEHCLAFASTEPVKEAQNGVYLIGSSFYSTDGDRVARFKNVRQGVSGELYETLFLPEKFCRILLKSKSKKLGRFFSAGNYLRYEDETFELTTATPNIEYLDLEFFEPFVAKLPDDNYFEIPQGFKDMVVKANIVLSKEDNKTLYVNIENTEWTFDARASSCFYKDVVSTTMDYFGGLEFKINFPRFAKSLEFGDRMGVTLSDDQSRCLLLLKDKDNLFAAMVATEKS